MFEKRFFIRLFLIVFLLSSMGISLCLAEALVPIYYPEGINLGWKTTATLESKSIHQLDRELIYSLRPGPQSFWETEEFVEINSLGLRNNEVSLEKDGYRILIIGDSFTFGHGVSLEQSYPKQLEKIINQNGLEKVEVINAGVMGYNLDQEYRLFTSRLFKLKPDLLIVTLGKGDFNWSDYPLYALDDNRLVSLEATKSWLYWQILLYNKAPDFIKESDLFLLSLASFTGKNFYNLNPFKKKIRLPQTQEDFMRKSLVQLQNLKELGSQRGYQLIVVFVPYDLRGEFKDERAFYNYYTDTRDFKKILKNNNFWVIDPNEIAYWSGELNSEKILGVQKINWQELSFDEDRHLNSQGNEIFAQIVFKGILDKGVFLR